VLTTLLGVAVVATQGRLQDLAEIQVNVGDGLMLAACFLYALYTLGLRRRPAVSAIGFFTAMALVAAITSLPLLFLEAVYGAPQWPTPFGWLLVVLIAIGPSLLSQLMFMRGVEQIGPARAGMFVNLVPIFGAFLAVIILGEQFAWHHGAALALVLGGILLAERGARSHAS
jgi:drug/metabolite transporter (DMT)-like permease